MNQIGQGESADRSSIGATAIARADTGALLIQEANGAFGLAGLGFTPPGGADRMSHQAFVVIRILSPQPIRPVTGLFESEIAVKEQQRLRRGDRLASPAAAIVHVRQIERIEKWKAHVAL